MNLKKMIIDLEDGVLVSNFIENKDGFFRGIVNDVYVIIGNELEKEFKFNIIRSKKEIDKFIISKYNNKGKYILNNEHTPRECNIKVINLIVEDDIKEIQTNRLNDKIDSIMESKAL